MTKQTKFREHILWAMKFAQSAGIRVNVRFQVDVLNSVVMWYDVPISYVDGVIM